jgi:hypothetical protein
VNSLPEYPAQRQHLRGQQRLPFISSYKKTFFGKKTPKKTHSDNIVTYNCLCKPQKERKLSVPL